MLTVGFNLTVLQSINRVEVIFKTIISQGFDAMNVFIQDNMN
jgi:hypothetical protein